ncbi:hypothetical protein [Streptomyces sp. NPDC002855]|uniref:hypothetical protein n=1 Tax=Streptomyces sp. NPDC002855 TaxID=3154437 RepID=UPI003318C8F7
MTVSIERPLVVSDPATVKQHLLADPYDEPQITLEFRATVSRDQIAAAVDLSLHRYYAGERHPDQWTVEEVRYHAEFQILYGSATELQEGAEGMAAMVEPDFYDQWAHARSVAVYRAVDRAYPELKGGRS